MQTNSVDALRRSSTTHTKSNLLRRVGLLGRRRQWSNGIPSDNAWKIVCSHRTSPPGNSRSYWHHERGARRSPGFGAVLACQHRRKKSIPPRYHSTPCVEYIAISQQVAARLKYSQAAADQLEYRHFLPTRVNCYMRAQRAHLAHDIL